MAKIAALALAASLLGGWEPANEDGEKHEKEGERGDWRLYTVADPFGDPEGWFAASPTVDGTGEVRFSCMTEGHVLTAGTPVLEAFAEGLGTGLPGIAHLEAMSARLKVDGGESRHITGFRPNHLAKMESHPVERGPGDRRLDGNDVVRMLQDGRRAVLRIEDQAGVVVRETASGDLVASEGSGRRVFAVSLDGFREASAWVMGRCGWRVR